tara:strand:- start:1136 stop:1753 length:618 start_codon:yes stop_codon:yes gene_type:complete
MTDSNNSDETPSVRDLLGEEKFNQLHNIAWEKHEEYYGEKINEALEITEHIRLKSKFLIDIEYWSYPILGALTIFVLSPHIGDIPSLIICGLLLFRFKLIEGLRDSYCSAVSSHFRELIYSSDRRSRILGKRTGIEHFLNIRYDSELKCMVDANEKDFYGHFSKSFYSTSILSIKQILLAHHKSESKASEKFDTLVNQALTKNVK